jgi:hypothetical protein
MQYVRDRLFQEENGIASSVPELQSTSTLRVVKDDALCQRILDIVFPSSAPTPPDSIAAAWAKISATVRSEYSIYRVGPYFLLRKVDHGLSGPAASMLYVITQQPLQVRTPVLYF